MRISRVRFTVRRLMFAVAIVSVVMGVTVERQARFSRMAAYHRAEFLDLINRSPYVSFMNFGEAVDRRIDWRGSMIFKYEHAARHPWLPIAPDPPEPN